MFRFTFACLAAALALSICACSEHERSVDPTPQIVKQLGLPLYPNATPVRRGAHELTMSSALGATVSMIVQYTTNDPLQKVREFYDQRLPSTKRVITIPMGQVSTVSMQFTDKTGQKQVSLVSIRDITLIQLQSTTLVFSQASPSPSGSRPNAAPSAGATASP